MWARRISIRVTMAAAVVVAVTCTSVALAPPASAAAETITYTRVPGEDRYQTAATLAVSLYQAGGAAFIVTGRNFADALAAGPVAAGLAAPILLTEPDSLPTPTRQAIVTLAPQFVFVVGGTGAVSNTVIDQILDVVPATAQLARVAGPDRYATAVEVAKAFDDVAPTRAYVASGVNFPDALAGGPAAGADVAPLFLTRPDDVPDGVMTKLTALAVDEVVILGGTAAVSQAVQDELDAAFPTVVRRAGADRYATAAAISAAAFDVEGGHTTGRALFLVNGERFPDALAAGAPAGAIPGPVLLTQKECIPQATAAEIARIAAAQPDGTELEVIAVGGFDVLGDNVVIDHKVCT